MTELREFADGAALAEGFADWTAARLDAAIAARGMALLIVSGGSTPKRYFAALSGAEPRLGARGHHLADERRVPDDSPRAPTPSWCARRCCRAAPRRRNSARWRIRVWPRSRNWRRRRRGSRICRCRPTSRCSAWARTATPPRGSRTRAGLAEAIDPAARALVAAMPAPDGLEPRLTLTGRALLRARALALQIEGPKKAPSVRARRGRGPVEDMPIRAVLRGAADRLTVFQRRGLNDPPRWTCALVRDNTSVMTPIPSPNSSACSAAARPCRAG